MRTLRMILSLLVVGSIAIFSSCDDGGDPNPQITGVLIVNEGNFGSGNGTISVYDEEAETFTNDAVKMANGGIEIASSIQSIFTNNGVGYIICNATDKIDFINSADLKFIANPLTEISQPRYMTAASGKGYITCWGPWDNWTLPSSYVAVMDLSSRAIIDSLECGSGPEGIISVGSKLFVANSFAMSVSVIDLSDNSEMTIDLDANPSTFALDNSGVLWIAKSTGLQSINTATLELGQTIAITDFTGKVAISGDSKSIYCLTTEPWEQGKINYASEVYVFDAESASLSSSPLITGMDIYGIGVNSTTSKIYIGDSKAFSGPGEVSIYDRDGKLLDKGTVGIGPNGIALK